MDIHLPAILMSTRGKRYFDPWQYVFVPVHMAWVFPEYFWGTPIAGWFISWKIPSINGWWQKGYPSFSDPSISYQQLPSFCGETWGWCNRMTSWPLSLGFSTAGDWITLGVQLGLFMAINIVINPYISLSVGYSPYNYGYIFIYIHLGHWNQTLLEWL